MSGIHSSNKPDSQKPLYKFNKNSICYELIAALKDDYKSRYNAIRDTLLLVPSDIYLITTLDISWSCSEIIEVTEEQVYEFLALRNICGMSFLEFMESKNGK